MGILSKSDNGWELHTISDGSLSCENSKLDSDDIANVEKMILPEYGERMKKNMYLFHGITGQEYSLCIFQDNRQITQIS